MERAARGGTPVVIVNRGTTRGDEHATYTLAVGCSEFLTALADRRATRRWSSGVEARARQHEE